ncbi:MAG: DUF6263 family protein [Planctomycetota bacterium]|nr:DUF6263 family protein [Planctomycetota bacterium]
MLRELDRRHSRQVLGIVLAFGLGLSGCGESSVEGLFGSGVPEVPVDSDVPHLTGSATDINMPSGNQNGAATRTEPEEGNLSFSLKVGDRFPLLKTIEQTLVQQSSAGPVTSRSNLTLMFAITVDEEDAGRRKLGVRYQRVKYSHEILGERLEYDSQTQPERVPDSLQVYNGLAGNSFSFWIGADNRIIEVIEFEEFLKRCVRHAPPHRQQELLTQIVATQEDEGFANFVDESIGLLPYNPQATGRETAVRVGQQWQKNRRVTRPLPMEMRTGYTLDSLTEDHASILVLGTIEPIQAAQLGPIQQAAAQQSISLEKGEIIGSCKIDRTTGLPLMSRVERRLDMTVTVPGQRPFQQKKTIVTTVESFPIHGTIFSRADSQSQFNGRVIRTDGIESRSPDAVTNAHFESAQPGQKPAASTVR